MSDLEIKLHQAQQQVELLNKTIEQNEEAKSANIKSLEQDKLELQQSNQELNEVLISKNDEIEKLKRLQFDVENKILNTD